MRRTRLRTCLSAPRQTAAVSAVALLLVWSGGCGGRSKPLAVSSGSMLADGGSPVSSAPAADPDLLLANSVPAVHKRWRYAEHIEGWLIETPNYRLYTTVNKPSFTDRLPRFYESALHHYCSSLGELPAPRGPLVTYLFATRRQWEGKTRQMLKDDAHLFSTLGRGGFTTQGTSVLFYIDAHSSHLSSDTFAIAAHEGWHQYTQQAFLQMLPVWLEEGLATYMESFSLSLDGEARFEPETNRERRDELRRAHFEDRLIPLEELLTRTPQDFLTRGKKRLLTYYAQAWAMTRFLSEGEDGRYREGLAQVLQDAARGRMFSRMMASADLSSGQKRRMMADPRVGPWIIQTYFHPDLAEFEAQYRAFIAEIVRLEG